MKRSFYALGLMLAATFTLTNCAKEIDSPVQEPESAGIPFEIMASAVDTKTTNNGLSTVWAEGDAMNVFHAEAGAATYVNNGQFTYGATENGNFAGTLAAELTAEAYDWYAFYPYSSYIKTPANTSSGYMPVGSKSNAVQTQTGNDSMAHIAGENYPMWGIAENVAVGETPTIIMTHLTSLIAVEVINEIPTGDDLTVESVSFTAPEGVDIVGTYYIDFSTSTPGFTGSGDNYVSSTAKLSVVDGTPIAVDESAKFYIAVKPFTAEAGATLELNVNGYSKTLTLQNDAVFTPGKIKNVSFAYDQAPVEVEALSIPWYEDFSSESLDNYITSNGGGETKLYTDGDAYAGGMLPELMIAKSQGTFTAKIATGGVSGDLTLVYLTNNDSRISVSSATEGITVTKMVDKEYVINVAEGVESFELTFTNTSSSNVRVDNIYLYAGLREDQILSFEESAYTFEVGSDAAASFAGQTVNGAETEVTYTSSNVSVATVNSETGEVTLGTSAGTATITASAVASDSYRAASATYTITLSQPVSGDITAGSSYSYSFDAKTFTSNSSIALGDLTWTLSGDGGYWGYDTNYGKGQQFGSGGKPYKSLTLSTSDYSGGVEKIVLNTSGASSIAAKLKVTVNGVQYGDEISLTSSATEYTFNAPDSGMQAGEIVFTYTQTSSKAIYIKSIAIN